MRKMLFPRRCRVFLNSSRVLLPILHYSYPTLITDRHTPLCTVLLLTQTNFLTWGSILELLHSQSNVLTTQLPAFTVSRMLNGHISAKCKKTITRWRKKQSLDVAIINR